MGQEVRGDAHRVRQNGRPGRLGRFLLIAAFNLVLWIGVIILIVRAT